jgi:tRNA A37 N6-isopentenylltransferase MiaA
MVQITNRKIISFFEQRPEMDIETTFLKFIDIMESLQENMNKTLTNTTVVEILDNLKTMNTKFDRSQEINQFNLSKYMNELKRDMNEEIKTIMSISMMEKVEPVLREKFKEQHLAFVNVTFDKITTMFDNKLVNINEISKSNKEILSSQNDKLTNLLTRFENSSNKGKLSENLVLNILKDIFPSAEINSVGQTKETGDILLLRTNKPKILIENKLWGRSVVQAEVVKFIRDIDIQKCSGIFLSQNGKITTKENFEINIHNGNVLVYVHEVHNDPDKIKLAVDIVDHLKEKLDEYEDYNNDQDNISKEMLEYINVEYQNFVSSKSSLVKLAKEFNQKLIKQIEDLKMPSLENYLSSKYSFSSNKFICEFCSFVGKNQQSKSAHIRGCVERKKMESQKNKNIGEQIICIDAEPS